MLLKIYCCSRLCARNSNWWYNGKVGNDREGMIQRFKLTQILAHTHTTRSLQEEKKDGQTEKRVRERDGKKKHSAALTTVRQCIETHFGVKKAIAAKRFAMFASEIGCSVEYYAAVLRWWIGSQIGLVCVIKRRSFVRSLVCSFLHIQLSRHSVSPTLSILLSLLPSPSSLWRELWYRIYFAGCFFMQCNCPFGCFW